jgi:PadR family transcriptional regulator, regulatory protein PadR
MGKGRYVGEFEQLILLAVLRLGETAYGAGIREEIVSRTGRTISRGAVYAALDRLEEKGLVKSWLGAPSAERGGRAKRQYEMTGTGELALSTSLDAVKRMAQGMYIPQPARS